MKVTVHLISDSTGVTCEAVANSSLAQFKSLEPVFRRHHFVVTSAKLDQIVKDIQQNPGIVFSTLAAPSEAKLVEDVCHSLKLPLISVLDEPVKKISDYTQITDYNWGHEDAVIGIQHGLTDDYQRRIDAIQFAIEHDDGQNLATLFNGDLVLLGVSRSSKTPTSIYLANKGYKTGNIPLIHGCEIDERLIKFLANPERKPEVVGLSISPERLSEIRVNRMKDLDPKSLDYDNPYVSLDSIKEELLESRKLFTAFNIKVIDVTRRSIEEIAARIIELL